MRLHGPLRDGKFQPIAVDPQVYVRHEDGQLVCMVSTHVDDLKGGGVQEEVNALITVLEKEFGKRNVAMGSTSNPASHPHPPPESLKSPLKHPAWKAGRSPSLPTKLQARGFLGLGTSCT